MWRGGIVSGILNLGIRVTLMVNFTLRLASPPLKKKTLSAHCTGDWMRREPLASVEKRTLISLSSSPQPNHYTD
jgi:hypothetical protein